MNNKNNVLGKFGEDIAVKFMKNRGYKVLYRNYRKKFGEIDIITKDQDGALVFVEVKTMTIKDNGLMPEDQVTNAKLSKLQRISQFFVNDNQDLINETMGWRIDLIAVFLEIGKSGKWHAGIRQYKGIG